MEQRKRRKLPPKTYWVTYGLQGLSTEKFLKTVQKILDGELILLKPADEDFEDLEDSGGILTELELTVQVRRKTEPVANIQEDNPSCVLV